MRTPEQKQKHTEYMREWTRKNAATINARRRERKAASPGEDAAKQREWRRRNPGKTAQYNKTAYAKDGEKINTARREAYAANPEPYNELGRRYRSRNKEALYAWRQKRRRECPEKVMLAASRKAAKNRGLDFNLELSDIGIPTHCPVLGTKLEIATGKRTDATPSLDRIVPSKGYTKGNVMVISWGANRKKNDSSVDDLVKLAKFYTDLTGYYHTA